MIEFNNLSVGFSSKPILEKLNGKIVPGQLIALMGINGKGKSCLIKTLSGLINKISGELMLNQRDLKSYSESERAKLLSIVLTDKIEIDFLIVEELISLGRSPYNGFFQQRSEKDNQIINSLSKTLGIDSLRVLNFSQLSDGQKQKVLTARALIQGPQFLFLDEPTTYLDIPSKIELMKTLRLMSETSRLGIVFSTHDLELVKQTVDLIWLIADDGTLYQMSPKEMESSGLFKKTFNL